MKFVLFLVNFLTFLHFGVAIKCYLCSGTKTSDCAAGKTSSMGIQNCVVPPNGATFPYSHDFFNSSIASENVTSLQAVCLRLTETNFDPYIVVRGCMAFPESIANPCKYIEAHFPVVGCKACTTNLCNKGFEVNSVLE